MASLEGRKKNSDNLSVELKDLKSQIEITKRYLRIQELKYFKTNDLEEILKQTYKKFVHRDMERIK